MLYLAYRNLLLLIETILMSIMQHDFKSLYLIAIVKAGVQDISSSDK